ncbi:hypothetical protein [Deinococcus sp. UYEF24]
MSFDRLHLGVYHPSDVIAAWADGVLWTAVAFPVLFRYHPLLQVGRLIDAERV